MNVFFDRGFQKASLFKKQIVFFEFTSLVTIKLRMSRQDIVLHQNYRFIAWCYVDEVLAVNLITF